MPYHTHTHSVNSECLAYAWWLPQCTLEVSDPARYNGDAVGSGRRRHGCWPGHYQQCDCGMWRGQSTDARCRLRSPEKWLTDGLLVAQMSMTRCKADILCCCDYYYFAVEPSLKSSAYSMTRQAADQPATVWGTTAAKGLFALSRVSRRRDPRISLAPLQFEFGCRPVHITYPCGTAVTHAESM